jgi:hypothetical protein
MLFGDLRTLRLKVTSLSLLARAHIHASTRIASLSESLFE